ncbi:DUF6233 domain-containing protein [Streptomyces sp. NPDC058476]|uniref:DUF6233 domain-containing protein n=1 Tax=Streptomyces sp. NPDC058476 TaxID=3346519 RepID=UPI00366521DF
MQGAEAAPRQGHPIERPAPVLEEAKVRRLTSAHWKFSFGRGVIHAVDCEEAPAGAPKLTLDKALDAAEHPGTRLCSLCSAAAELDPALRGFEHGFGGSENDSRGTQ